MITAASVIDQVNLFSGLDRTARTRLAAKLRERHFRPGDEVTHEEHAGVGFFIIGEGTAIAQVHAHQVARLHAGQWFGETALLTGETRSATVTAETDLRCFVLPEWDFRELLDAYPDVTRRMLTKLAERLRAAPQPLPPPETAVDDFAGTRDLITSSPELCELLDDPGPCVFATASRTGLPQVSLVWIERRGNQLALFAKVGTEKIRNITRDRRVVVTVADPRRRLAPGTPLYARLTGRAEILSGEPEMPHRLARAYGNAEGYPFTIGDIRTIVVTIDRITGIGPQYGTGAQGGWLPPEDRDGQLSSNA